VETWTFDVADQPTKVVSPTGTTTFTFDDAGNQLLTTSPNGTIETRVWDRNGYLSSITSKKGSTVLTSQTVTRDNANQPTKTVVVRSGTTENRSYLYDTNERITAVCYAATCTTGTATQQWTYDKDGNRLTETNGVSSPVTTTWTYDTSDRILTQKIGTAAATAPTYDPDGDLTNDGTGRSWTYRLDGLQATSTAAGATTTFGYDGDGHRTSAAITAGTGTGGTTAYTWDTNTPLAMLAGISRDPDGTGPTAPSITAIRYDGAGTGTALTQTVDGTTSWYAHDPLGSVTDLVSTTGTITRAQDWTPYGANRAPAGAPGTPTGPAFGLGWTGALPDSDGTWHLRARQYDPSSGAFTARDPRGYAGSAGENYWYGTTYGYVVGRTVSMTDPSGEWPCDNGADSPGCAFLGGVGAVMYNTGYAVTHPIETYHQTVDACNAGFDKWGGSVLEGTLQCIDNINPAAQIRDQGKRAYDLYQAGCTNEAIYEGTQATVYGALYLAPMAKVAIPKLGIGSTTAAAESEVPTVVFSRSRAPGIAGTFDDAVADGAPTQLNRVTGAARDANRRAALRGQSPAPAGQSLDEYPFACSAQGGCGSTVRSVPVGEQSYQGGVLSRFFQDNGVGIGDPFNVTFGP